MSKILVLQGYPDPAGGHLCHALADSCAAGAAEGGHEVRRIEVARLDFPLLRTPRKRLRRVRRRQPSRMRRRRCSGPTTWW